MRSALIIWSLALGGLLAGPALAGPQWQRQPVQHIERRAPPPPPPQRAPPSYPQPRPAAPPAAYQAPRAEQQQGPMPRNPYFAPPSRGLSAGEAAQRAQQLNGGGRVLAVDPADSGYRVRVLKNGEVRSVYVPGQ